MSLPDNSRLLDLCAGKLKRLKADGLVDFSGGVVAVHDAARQKKAVQFSGDICIWTAHDREAVGRPAGDLV